MISAAFGLVSQMKMAAPPVSTMLLPADHPCIIDVGKRYIEVAGSRKEEIESHEWGEKVLRPASGASSLMVRVSSSRGFVFISMVGSHAEA